MSDVLVPINAPGNPIETFREADGSGWMKMDDWELWRAYMSGDHDDRERGRRHQPAMQAYAAALITGVPREEAEHIKSEVYQEARREWQRKHGTGHIIDQFVRHFEFHHAIGKIALYFVPYLGPFLSGIAGNFDPMVEAAQKKAIADHEAENVSEKFRQDYYAAMDSWIRGETESIPVDFLRYHAEVVAPAALAVKEDMADGVLETESGLYPISEDGLALWVAQGENYQMNYYGGPLTSIKQEFSMNLGPILIGTIFAIIAGLGLHAIMSEL